MYLSKEIVEKKIKPGDKVLDIGSWNDIFPRADVIIDVNPYETRKNNFPNCKEFFTKKTWFEADVNNPDTWKNFKDKEFDFVICSHLLEDVRDPLYVCREIIRVSKSGYVEVPTLYRECARTSLEIPLSGYDHHRWLIEIINNSLVFKAKLNWAHTIDYLGDLKRHYMSRHNFHYFGFFWNDSFHFYERCPKGELLEGANLVYLYENLDISNLIDLNELPSLSHFTNLKDTPSSGSMLWVDKFLLPIEQLGEDILATYKEKYLNKISGENFVNVFLSKTVSRLSKFFNF